MTLHTQFDMPTHSPAFPRPICLLLISTLFVAGSAYGQMIDVTQAVDSLITESRSDQILSQGNSSVQIEGGPGTCLLTLHRDNPIQVVSGDVINGADDFTAVCSQPGYVHVVDQINWCGTTAANVIGCSQMPGHCVVVMRYQDALEWNLWMHEYGHSKGLDHRDAPRALMAPVIDPAHDSVNVLECAKVQNMASAGTPGPPIAGTPSSKVPISEFVKRTYYEGTPYPEARSYKEQDAEQLISMMKDPGMRPYLANIVTTLGMIGGKRATEPIISFISSQLEESDLELARARKSALIALGYIVNQTNDARALKFLLDGASNETWKKRIPAASSKSTEHLACASILGLALTGKRTAHAKLASIRDEKVTPDSRARINAANQGLREHDQITKLGITKYYSKDNR